jgi:hypothetical protein
MPELTDTLVTISDQELIARLLEVAAIASGKHAKAETDDAYAVVVEVLERYAETAYTAYVEKDARDA